MLNSSVLLHHNADIQRALEILDLQKCAISRRYVTKMFKKVFLIRWCHMGNSYLHEDMKKAGKWNVGK